MAKLNLNTFKMLLERIPVSKIPNIKLEDYPDDIPADFIDRLHVSDEARDYLRGAVRKRNAVKPPVAPGMRDTPPAARVEDRLSLVEFKRRVRFGKPEDLAQLRPEQIPDRIPSGFLAEAPEHMRQVLEPLIFEALSRSLAEQIRKYADKSPVVVKALDASISPPAAIEVDLFKDELTSFMTRYKEIEALRSKALYDKKKAATVQTQLQNLRRETEQLDEKLVLLNEYRNRLETYTETLVEGAQQYPDDAVMFQDAAARINSQLRELDRAIGPYLTYRLQIVNEEMSAQKGQIKALEERTGSIQAEIDQINEQLEGFTKKQLRNQSILASYSAKRERLGELYDKKAENEIVVSESNLTQWLDTFVEAHLNPVAMEQIGGTGPKAKLSLFYLLSRYCESQEDSARQLAAQTSFPVDADKAVEFMLMSERFVLDYFASKKKETSKGISESAKLRRQALGVLEKDLVDELETHKSIFIEAAKLSKQPEPEGHSDSAPTLLQRLLAIFGIGKRG